MIAQLEQVQELQPELVLESVPALVSKLALALRLQLAQELE